MSEEKVDVKHEDEEHPKGWSIQVEDEEGKGRNHEPSKADEHPPSPTTSFADALKEINRLSEKKDPEKTPYKSKYKARSIMVQWRAELIRLDKEADGKNEETKERLGVIEYLLGVNYIETEETSLGETELLKSVPKLQGKPLLYCLELLDGLNQLGIVNCNRQQNNKSLEFLNSSKDIYSKALEAKKSNSLPSVLQESTNWETVEAKHTHTLFYLAQVYSHLKKPSESATYCQLTLSRQLLAKTPLPSDWSQNCIGLAFFFTEEGKLRQAEYCLNAAESQMKPSTTKKEEQTSEIRANLNRGRGHFYLTWLRMSVHHLDSKEDKENKTRDELVIFEGLKGKINEPTSCPLATNFSQAKGIWQKGLKAFTDASEYYVLDGFVSEHIEILQDISALYKELVPFEKDLSHKCKLHKRRITKLEHLIDELNKSVYLQFYQQLTDEVARTYSDLVDLKLQLRDKEMSQKKTFSALKKN